MVVEDALSRLPTYQLFATDEPNAEPTTAPQRLFDMIRHQGLTDAAYIAALEEAQSNDTVASKYVLLNDLVCLRGTHQIYVPNDLRLKQRVLELCHDGPTVGHQGIKKTTEALQQHFHWPGMTRDAMEYCNSCPTCQRIKTSTHARSGFLQPLAPPSRPFESLSIDFMVDLPLTPRGHDSVITVVDRFSKMIFLLPATNAGMDAEHVIDRLFDSLLSITGLPKDILSDRDVKFTGRFWKSMADKFFITLKMSSAYHPQTNGQTEVANRIAQQILRGLIAPDQRDWDLLLPMAQLAYNSRVHSATGVSPIEAAFGWTPRTPLALLHEELTAAQSPVDAWLEARRSFFQQVRTKLLQHQDSVKRQVDKHRRAPPVYRVGDLVRIHRRRYHGPLADHAKRKLDDQYFGPFKVSAVFYSDRGEISSVRVVDPNRGARGRKKDTVYNIGDIEPVTNSERFPREAAPAADITPVGRTADGADLFEIVAIRGHEYRKYYNKSARPGKPQGHVMALWYHLQGTEPNQRWGQWYDNVRDATHGDYRQMTDLEIKYWTPLNVSNPVTEYALAEWQQMQEGTFPRNLRRRSPRQRGTHPRG